MQERLNNPLDKVKIVVISFILTIGWLTLGCYFPIVSYFTWLPLIILTIFFIVEKISDKYLVPVIFSITVLSNLIEILLNRRILSIPEEFLLLMDFLCTIFILFFLFSIRFIQEKSDQNSEKRVEIIIKKLLWLILIVIVAIIIFFFSANFLDHEN